MVQYSNFEKIMEARDHFTCASRSASKNMASSKKLMVALLLFLFVVSTFGQTRSLSREQMIQDMDVLFSTIEEVHPDMYAVYPKEKLDKDIERVKSELEPSGDIFYFYKQVAPLVVKLGDGHTNVSAPYHDPSDFVNELFFPFSVMVTYPDKLIFVQKDYTQTRSTIPIDAQITSINNRQANDVVQEMMNYLSGEKDFYKINGVGNWFIPLMHTLYRDSIFDIEYIFNQERYSVQVNGVLAKEIIEKDSQQDNPVPRKKYAFSVLPEKNIGVIEFNEFMDIDRFKVFLDSTFQILQKENIGNLIIDIRKNGGGYTTLGDELFQYISLVPFAQFGKSIVKYSDIQKQNYKNQGYEPPNNPNGIEIYNENAKLTELKENKLRYKGDVFLLISHRTFSSAASFSWAFKYFKMGTVIGEESGGMAVSFGGSITEKLPNTGIFYSISHKKMYHYGATDDNIHGTLPDYEVEAEKALDFTINLITREK